MNLHSMYFELISSFEGNKFFIKTIFFHADIMGHFIMCFEIIISFVVTVFMLRSTDITCNMLHIDVTSKLIIIEKVGFTKITIWV